jgi:hypothetical protein
MNTKIDLKFMELKALYIANILSAIAKNFRKNCKCKNSLGVILVQKRLSVDQKLKMFQLEKE